MKTGCKKDVMILTGAGQIGMAVARRMGYGKKIIIGDKSKTSAEKHHSYDERGWI